MIHQRRRSTAKLLQSLAGCALLGTLLLLIAPSCGGGSHGGNCNAADTASGWSGCHRPGDTRSVVAVVDIGAFGQFFR